MTRAEGSDPVFGSAIREMSRAHMAEIWQRGSKEDALSQDDYVLYRAMQEHPEYTDVWENARELADREVEIRGTNPFLHISLHTVIEQQLAERNPPETGQTLFRLTRHGLGRHEAVHRIAGVLCEIMSRALREQKTFDLATYQRRLRALKP